MESLQLTKKWVELNQIFKKDIQKAKYRLKV
jgi:hypothetical protein